MLANQSNNIYGMFVLEMHKLCINWVISLTIFLHLNIVIVSVMLLVEADCNSKSTCNNMATWSVVSSTT